MGSQRTKAQVAAAWVDGAVVGPDDAASTDDLWESLAFRNGDNTFTDEQEFEASIIGAEIATPASPAASHRKLYAKSDGWYQKDSGGTEERLAAAGDILGGATATAQLLKEWTEAGAYEMTSVSRDAADDVISSATVKWPDGSAGTFTRTTKNSTWLAIDAYTITHTDSSQTVTQSAVTRNSTGAITAKPALVVT